MLDRGDRVPEVTLVDADGSAVALSDLLQRPTVLYFYPKDDTPGCTAEACAFRDSYDAFVEAGAEVIGVSSDDARSHGRFREKHGLPFRLMSDPQGSARRAFGIPKTLGIVPGRATFVIDTNGEILYAFNSQFSPAQHIARSLQVLTNKLI
jgi:peroxiredoxin Q/BCP